MRAVVIGDDRSLRTVELAEPGLEPDEVRIAVRFCGICGSDLHMRDMPFMPAGVVMGHEFMGVITETGAEVTGWAPGERVVANPFDPCRTCEHCSGGRPELCATGMQRGVGLGARYGAYAESVVAPQTSLFRLPEEVSDQHGALAEPLAVGLHAVNLASPGPGAAAVVLGAGPIGIMTALALRAKGTKKIVVVEPTGTRRQAIGTMGFDATGQAGNAPQLLGTVPRAVFDCTGHPDGVAAAVDMAAPAGQIVVVGVPSHPSTVHMAPVATKELQIRGSLAYTNTDFAEAIEILATGRVPAAELITTVAPLDAAEHWFRELTSGTTRQIKVLLQP